MSIPKYCEKILTIHFGEPPLLKLLGIFWNITESKEWPVYKAEKAAIPPIFSVTWAIQKLF